MDQQSIDIDIQVSVVTKKLSNLLAQQVFVQPSLKREVRWATNDLHEYLRRFRDSAQKHKKDQLVPIFELRVLQDCFLMEDITDTFLIEMAIQRQKGIARRFIRLSSVWSQKFLLDEMKNVRLSFITFWKKSLEELILFGNNIDEKLSSETTYGNNSSLHTNNVSDVSGLKEREEVLLAEILCSGELGSQLRVIPIVGIACSGKTTLANTIYNKKDIKNHFKLRAWIRVSTRYNVRDLLIDICKQVMRKEAKVESEQDYYDLRQGLGTLLEKNKYLIVMDDVWSTHFWDEVKLVFPDNKMGSRILVTTCDNEVARCVSSRNDLGGQVIQMNRLNGEDIWALFLKNMRCDEDSFNDLRSDEIKKSVLRKCDGSPLAVTKLCHLVSAKGSHHHEWLKLIDDHVSSGDEQAHQSSFSSSLTLSYQDLSPRIRPCYLYMGLFPRAFEIPIRRLFRLWIAEGLVKPDLGSSDKTPEDVAEEYFKELVSKNMIEVTSRKSDGRPKTCRIPGILYDVFSAKAMGLGLFFVHRYSDYTSFTPPKFNVRRLAEYVDMKNYPSSDVHNQHLRSYISFNTKRRDTPAHDVGIFLDKLTAKRGFGLLRVLDLEGVYKPRLPESLGKLLQLRYLGLRWTFLDSLTDSVGGLVYLETLDVKHTNISTLSTSIWKAKNLRHLYMSEVHFDMSFQKRPTGSLANLQTLWGLSIGNTSLVVNWLSKLVGLRKLGLTCHSKRVQDIADWIAKLTNLQSLKLRSIDEFGQPSDLKLADMTEHHRLSDLYLLGVLPKLAATEVLQFPLNLKILTLAGSQLGEDSIRMLGELPQLNILRLFGRSYSSRQIICRSGDFPKLVVLKLWMLDELTAWEVEEGAMPRLRELEIRCCQKMERVKGLQHLTILKDLTLTNMPIYFVQDVKTIIDEAIREKSMDEALNITVNEWKF